LRDSSDIGGWGLTRGSHGGVGVAMVVGSEVSCDVVWGAVLAEVVLSAPRSKVS
jgi:hypothetical protein